MKGKQQVKYILTPLYYFFFVIHCFYNNVNAQVTAATNLVLFTYPISIGTIITKKVGEGYDKGVNEEQCSV